MAMREQVRIRSNLAKSELEQSRMELEQRISDLQSLVIRCWRHMEALENDIEV